MWLANLCVFTQPGSTTALQTPALDGSYTLKSGRNGLLSAFRGSMWVRRTVPKRTVNGVIAESW